MPILSDDIVVNDGWSIQLILLQQTVKQPEVIQEVILYKASSWMISNLEHNEEKIMEWTSEKCDSSILQTFSSVSKC